MRIPVWIFTGPLGAGKSTVINAVLDALPKSSNPACITHHFAMSYGCESTPVRRDPASAGRSKSHANETAARLNLAFYDEVYDFGSGCICCSPKGDFARRLWALARWNDEDLEETQKVTHLFVETTGLGEPDAFAKLFFHDDVVAAAFELRCVVAVVNPANVARALDEVPPAGLANKPAAQLATASVLCVNPRAGPDGPHGPDDADDGRERALEAAAPGAVVVDASALASDPKTFGANCLRALADAPAYDQSAAARRDPSFADADADATVPLVQTSLALGSSHDGRVVTACCAERGALNRVAFVEWIQSVCAAGGGLARCKGDVELAGERGRRLVVDGVGGALTLREEAGREERSREEAEDGAKGQGGEGPKAPLCGDASCEISEHRNGDRPSRVFFAGKSMKVSKLRAGFRACFVPKGFEWAADVEVDFPGHGDTGKEVEVRGERVALWRVDGQFKAIAAICPHAGGELAKGSVLSMGEGGQKLLSCPVHFFTFDMESGECVTAKSCSRAKVYETRVALGGIYVRVQGAGVDRDEAGARDGDDGEDDGYRPPAVVDFDANGNVVRVG